MPVSTWTLIDWLQVITGMKGIKMQAWERSFQERLESLRNAELTVLRKYLLVKVHPVWSHA